MDVTQLPFNRHIGLEPCPDDSVFLVSLPEGPQYLNHLGTIHASALLAVAEAGSGAFLVRHFASGANGAAGVVPVVRRLEAKFKKPARGRVSARCDVGAEKIARWSEAFATKDRMSICIPVEVIDTAGVVVLSAVVEWLVARA